jgi:CheY-like chemotaxis protein
LSLVDDIAGGSRSLPDGADTDQGSPDQAGTLAAEIPDSSTQATTGGRRGSASVLLIEDDALERQRIGSFIEAAGYEVTRAASGEEGLGLLRSRPFEVVVLDLIMPDMTGLDVLRAARTEERLAEVRFIVLSAMYMTKNERQVLGPRVADVVRKGEAMPRELTLALQRAIKTPPHFDSHMHPGDGGRRL